MENATPTRQSSASKKNDLRTKIMRQVRDLGDALERAGEKIEKNGWGRVGQTIYRFGNSLERLNEKKPRKTTRRTH